MQTVHETHMLPLIPEHWDALTLEMEANFLVRALDVTAPKRRPSTNKRQTWWTDALEALKQETHFARKRMDLTYTQDDRLAYASIKREFKRAMLKAKRDSWKDFTSQATKMKSHAKLNKIIYRTRKLHVGSIRADTGDTSPWMTPYYNSSPNISLEIAMAIHGAVAGCLALRSSNAIPPVNSIMIYSDSRSAIQAL